MEASSRWACSQMRLARALASSWGLPAVQDMGEREFRPEQTNRREPIRSEATPDPEELLVALPADRLRAHAGKFAVGVGDGIALSPEDRGSLPVRPPAPLGDADADHARP